MPGFCHKHTPQMGPGMTLKQQELFFMVLRRLASSRSSGWLYSQVRALALAFWWLLAFSIWGGKQRESGRQRDTTFLIMFCHFKISIVFFFYFRDRVSRSPAALKLAWGWPELPIFLLLLLKRWDYWCASQCLALVSLSWSCRPQDFMQLLPKVLSPNTITLALGLQVINVGGHKSVCGNVCSGTSFLLGHLPPNIFVTKVVTPRFLSCFFHGKTYLLPSVWRLSHRNRKGSLKLIWKSRRILNNAEKEESSGSVL